MITDKLLRISNEQAIGDTENSDYSIDLGVVRDIGEGERLYVVFTIVETFAALTNLTIILVTDDNATLTSPATLRATPTITLASGGLAAGKQYILDVPLGLAGVAHERYLGAVYTVVGATATAGKITADVVHGIQDGMKFQTSGFAVT